MSVSSALLQATFQLPPFSESQGSPSIAHSKPCCAAQLGYQEIKVQVLVGDIMAGGGGAAGQAMLICHQAPGTQALRSTSMYISIKSSDDTYPVFGVCTLSVQ